MLSPQLSIPLHDEIFVDNFAGGGGASTGIERALGRPVDHALNHDRKALAMHRMNHPTTHHHCEDIRHADPLKICGDRRVGGIWFSPDCKHHSKARGGKPRDKKIRGLAWSIIHWINMLKARPVGGTPRIIYFENVEEFQSWCPLFDDGTINPWRKQWFFLCLTGAMFRRGFRDIEWAPGDGFIYRRTWEGIERLDRPEAVFTSRASDYGAPTIRRRLYLMARSDGRPLIWRKQTHAEPETAVALDLKPHRIIAQCLDFSHPCHSIFMERAEAKARKIKVQRPLADASMARIAKGVGRYVINAKQPFLVSLTHQGDGNWPCQGVDTAIKTITGANRGEKALVCPSLAVNTSGHPGAPVTNAGPTITTGGQQVLVEAKLAAPFITEHANATHQRNFPANEPSRSICAEVKGGHFALVAPYLVPRYGERPGQEPRSRSVERAGPVIVGTGNGASLCAAYLAQHNGGENGHQSVGHPLTKPVSTLNATGAQQQLVAATLLKYYGAQQDPRMDEAAPTITTVDRFGLAEIIAFVPPFTPELEASARRVAAFLRAHGVEFEGEFAMVGEFVIVDIGMRMLKPRELYLAQGFPLTHIIDRGLDLDPKTGRLFEIKFTGTQQVRMVGNSVCPIMAEILVADNSPEMCLAKAA